MVDQKNPESARELYRSAIHSGRLGNYDLAIESLRQAIQLDENFAEAYFRRAEHYRVTQLYDKAIKDYDRALELKEGFGIVHKYRAVCFAQLKQFDQAYLDISKFIDFQQAELDRAKNYKFRTERVPTRLQRGKAWALNFRGNIYVLAKNFEQAISDFDQSLLLDPQLFEVYYHRALALEVLGKRKRALVDLRRFQQLCGGFGLKQGDQIERLQKAKVKIQILTSALKI